MPTSEREYRDAGMSPVPERSARQQRLRCRQAQEALSAVWLSVYPPHLTWEATRDEGSRSALVSEWHLHASHRVPPASIGPVRAQLAQNLCSGALREAGAYQQSD